MKTISESINTMESIIPALQDRIMYNHFDNGVQPIVFQDAIIKKMDLTPPPPPAVPIIPTPQINNITPQVQHIQQPQSSNIPVLDLRPVDSYSLYYTEPAPEPDSDDNIKNNIIALSIYFDIPNVDHLIKNKDICANYNIINALEILKLRILNEKKVLDEFSKFVLSFNASNDKNRRMEIHKIDDDDIDCNVIFAFNDTKNGIFYSTTVSNTEEIKYDTDQDGNKYCINSISFHILPY